ncbi:MAG: type II toxin-antitoxin system VapC family toxin [Pseudonocardia sp.]|nr:type II toxin-antitoxin system VapC family toxin [Pseudonocardia sp.]
MRLLLDTQVWLWMVQDPARLSAESRDRLVDPSSTLLLSAASSWEIAIKSATGKLDLPAPARDFVPSRMQRDAVDGLPVTHAHALQVATLPPLHRDPFDRLLVAQAQLERIPIMTADGQIPRYDVEVLPAA